MTTNSGLDALDASTWAATHAAMAVAIEKMLGCDDEPSPSAWVTFAATLAETTCRGRLAAAYAPLDWCAAVPTFLHGLNELEDSGVIQVLWASDHVVAVAVPPAPLNPLERLRVEVVAQRGDGC